MNWTAQQLETALGMTSITLENDLIVAGTGLDFEVANSWLDRCKVTGNLAEYVDGRKVWATKAEFWDEFTESEQLAIMDSTVAGIRLLERQLLLWNGEVWSDDPKVQAGLAGLVAVGILTNDRKQAILAT